MKVLSKEKSKVLATRNGWSLAQALDLGDLLGVDGSFGRTKMGELTIFADAIGDGWPGDASRHTVQPESRLDMRVRRPQRVRRGADEPRHPRNRRRAQARERAQIALQVVPQGQLLEADESKFSSLNIFKILDGVEVEELQGLARLEGPHLFQLVVARVRPYWLDQVGG